jgi:pSer/pThr/pTyr-binding forkhead associated (FHA) protein
MSLLTEILVKAGLARKQPPPVRAETRNRAKAGFASLFRSADTDGQSLYRHSRSAADNTFKSTQTRYAPIRKAVEERLEKFVRRDVVSHLEIAREDVFMLHYLEIHAENDATLLDEFLEEFTQAARIEWVKRLLAAAPESHVRVDQFLGLDKQFSQEHLEQSDAYEEELSRDAAVAGYNVILHGRWERQQASRMAENAARIPRVPGPGIRLTLHDANEKTGVAASARQIDVNTFPAVLGSSPDADVQIRGYYVSATHCTLHSDGDKLWIEDHSKNGTWLNGSALEPARRVEVSGSAVLRFGANQDSVDYERFPVVHVQLVNSRMSHASATPIAPSRATPIASARTPISSAKAALAVLAVTDATGTAHKVVCEVPFTIGRGSDQNYVVPDENAGVSREHLVIEKITETGATTTNKGVDRNGTFAAEAALPQQFEWQFDQEIMLASKWTRAAPARIRLKRPEQ